MKIYDYGIYNCNWYYWKHSFIWLWIPSLERRRSRSDMIETYRILSGKENINSEQFIKMSQHLHSLQWRSICDVMTKVHCVNCHCEMSGWRYSPIIVVEIVLHLGLLSFETIILNSSVVFSSCFVNCSNSIIQYIRTLGYWWFCLFDVINSVSFVTIAYCLRCIVFVFY